MKIPDSKPKTENLSSEPTPDPITKPQTWGSGWGSSSTTEEEPAEIEVKPKKWKGRLLKVGLPALIVTSIGVGYFGYFFAPVADIPEGSRASTSLQQLLDCSYNKECFDNLNKGSWLGQEVDYANGSDIKLGFLKHTIDTVKMKLPSWQPLNWWGSPAKSPWSWESREGVSTLNFGESATFTVPDWSRVIFNKKDLANLAKEAKLTKDSVDYSDKLTLMFALYMSKEKLPTKTLTHKPVVDCSGEGIDKKCSVNLAEDAFWDKTLFSSKDFKQLQDKFANEVAEVLEVPALIPPEVDITKETPEGGTPSHRLGRKYPDKFYLDPAWIGAYSLKMEAEGKGNNLTSGGDSLDVPDTQPRVGDGSFKNPAGVGTPVLTKVKSGGDWVPIEVTLTKIVEGRDTYPIFSEHSIKNKGFSTSSDIKYAYMVFKIKNPSDKEVEVYLNDSLSDVNLNLRNRVGIMYGLKDQPVTLKSGESVSLESWTSSPILDQNYLIWGADFPPDQKPIWFKVFHASEQH